MSQFPRPNGAIEDYCSLNIGDVIWHVYGIWPPQDGGQATVTKAPAPFSEHREWSEIHSNGSAIVFDVQHDGWDRPVMEFASDGNLIPGHSHNDNYWFKNEDDAAAAIDFLRSQWEARPDMIERSDADRMMLLDDNYGYDYCETDAA